MGLGRSRRSSTPYALSLGFVGVVDKARNVTSQEHLAAIEESNCRQAALTPILEGSENKSWKKDEEGGGSEGEGRSLVE